MSIDVMKGLISGGGGLARNNLFRVILPSFNDNNISADELNLLCSRASLPFKQISTRERMIGPKPMKLPYAITTEDTNMTFLVMNDYKIKKYFDAWQNRIINNDTYEVSYLNDYARDIQIDQLKQGYKGDVNGADSIPSENIIYSCKLLDAYPTTLSQIDFTNDLNGIVEVSVSFSYRKWEVIEN